MDYIISEYTNPQLSSLSDAERQYFEVRTANELNLDCDAGGAPYLMAFWFRYQGGQGYRELFPAGGKGTKRATADLANYASNKATAMSCRLRGDINTAVMYEDICDRIYARLPDWAKGW